jgi:dienelactone hydrolase
MAVERRSLRGFRLLALVAPLLLAGAAGAEEFRLEPAFPETPLRGPAAAKGAVIWNHGINFIYGAEGAAAALPMFVTLFRDADWDVFRLLRPRMSEEPRSSAGQLVASAQRLRHEGYAKIVLTGQSGGAWLSLMAAGRSEDIHAVIANAPAYYGTDRPTYLKNAYILFDYLDDIRRGRIMISYFGDDPFDPGGRGEKSDELLAAHAVPHLVLDRPEGLGGHSAGNSGLFVRRFGACVLAVAGDGPMPARAACESDWGKTPSAEFARAANFRPATPSGGPADRFLGKWYGAYGNGREAMLVIEHATGGEVEAAYLVGAGPDAASPPALVRRSGHVDQEKLVFQEKGQPTLRYALRPDGMLDAQWVAADEFSRLSAAFHRVD